MLLSTHISRLTNASNDNELTEKEEHDHAKLV